ncbi:hypothetical protein [Paludisphaera mucosa]|uniref:Uncharacterized protein n=1 Tax=Paludisphaera mucosa TaxID=3030827 RepID=A0ABT6FL57_9BACT|nr:hypothetical protein [Paludisphaera mucosa]MDG3008310.1 hypothetical protein [Paludisphaera mucosa]
MQLYPNARLLIAAKDDLARERRKVLTAKMASGEWDGVIVTHSSFERIGMSRVTRPGSSASKSPSTTSSFATRTAATPREGTGI